MRIEQVEYRDQETGWSLASTEFFPDLTLLIGMSGAGKTRILQSLRTLRMLIRQSDSPPKVWGVTWKFRFVIADVKYLWEGEYEPRPEDDMPGSGTGNLDFSSKEDDDDITTGPKVLRERLYADDQELISRDAETIRLLGEPTPKLSPFKSSVALLGEEERIKPVVDGFGHIAYINLTSPSSGQMIHRFDKFCNRYRTTEAIRDGDLPTYAKLALLYEVDKSLFGEIVDQFRQVFPLVEDVRFERIFMGPFSNIPDLRVKEIGIHKWIPERHISSGMFRTLMHLASVALWPDKSVILIDEFENSLGVNCLDDVTGHLMGQRKRLQFVVTSHHPYIINKIPPKHWKVVMRKGGEVRTVNAADAGIGKSRHEAFIQLMNSPMYQDGVTVQ